MWTLELSSYIVRYLSNNLPTVLFVLFFRYKYDEMFDALNPIDGKISGGGNLHNIQYGNSVLLSPF